MSDIREDYLLQLAYKTDNDWNKIYSMLKDHVPYDDNLPMKDVIFSHSFSPDYVTFCSKGYNEHIRSHLYAPPFVLRYKGDISAFSRNNYYFLIGDNIFGIPNSDLITYNSNSKTITIGGVLEMYINDNGFDILRTAVGLSKAVILQKETNAKVGVENYVVENALYMGIDVCVTPTANAYSLNSDLIFDGATPLRDSNDFKVVYGG